MKNSGAQAAGAARIESIQHLRLLAASLVIIYHSQLHLTRLADGSRTFEAGFGAAGTDLFFVIGGFILVYTSDRLSVGQFLFARIMRVAPLYWLFTLIMLGLFLAMPWAFHTTKFDPNHFLASLLFLPYPHPVLGIERPFLFPGWILNYFVPFYVLFGLFLAWPLERRVAVLSAILCALSGLWFVARGSSPLLDFYGAPVILEFVFGMTIGWLYRTRRMPLAVIVLALGVSAIVFSAGVANGVSGGEERALFWGVADAGLLFACVFVEKQWGWFSHGLLRLLGDATYSIYLSNLFALAMVTKLIQWLGLFPAAGQLATQATLLVGTICMGLLVHLYIERPILAAVRSLRVVPAQATTRNPP